MGSYRYIVADTKTGLPLGELPLSVDSFSTALGEGGTLSGTLPLAGAPNDWYTVTTPGKTALHVIRDDNQIVWGGPIVGRAPSGTDKASLRAETFEQWLKRRKIKTDLTYTSVDVFDIIRDVLDVVQGHTGGSLNIVISAALAGYTQTIAWKYEDRAVVWDEIKRLSEVGNLFEAYFTIAQDITLGGLFTPQLHFASPQVNTWLEPIALEYPGNVLSYTYPEAVEANAVAGLGKGDGVSKLIAEEIDAAGQLAEGWPLVDADLSLGEEDDLTRLDARTKIELTANLIDNVIPEVTINGDLPELQFGSFPLGIPCRLRATSLYHPAAASGAPGLDITRRVVGWSVKPPSDGGVEEVTLTLASGLGKIRPPLNEQAFQRWLRALELRMTKVETRR